MKKSKSSNVESAHLNVWSLNQAESINRILDYVLHFSHPQAEIPAFEGGYSKQLVTPTNLISGNELPMVMGFPKKSVSGLAVVEMAEFGRTVVYENRKPRRSIEFGSIYHMGVVENTRVKMDLDLLASHCFITGSSGSGKSYATYQLLEQLSSGLIELALVRTPFSKQGLTSVPLIEEPLLAVGSKRYFQSKNPITLSDLSGLPLIMYRRWEPILLESFREAGLVPHVFCKNDDARTSVIWADAGLGISILPASAFGLVKNPDTVSRQISDLPLTSSICLVRSQDTWISTAARAFLNCLSETYDHPFT